MNTLKSNFGPYCLHVILLVYYAQQDRFLVNI